MNHFLQLYIKVSVLIMNDDKHSLNQGPLMKEVCYHN